MKRKVYIESSVVSDYTGRPSCDVVIAGRPLRTPDINARKSSCPMPSWEMSHERHYVDEVRKFRADAADLRVMI